MGVSRKQKREKKCCSQRKLILINFFSIQKNEMFGKFFQVLVTINVFVYFDKDQLD